MQRRELTPEVPETHLEEPSIVAGETALLSEDALSDWSRPEEDAAWSHLQPAN